MSLKWCDYQAENELGDFADLLFLAVQEVVTVWNKQYPDKEIIYRYEFDTTTPTISFERGGTGPSENVSFGYSLAFKAAPDTRYFRIGKIAFPSNATNIYVWFPIGSNHNDNKKWYDALIANYDKRKYYNFTEGASPAGDAWIALRPPYNTAFFNNTTNDTFSMSQQKLLEEFLNEVLLCSP